MSKSLTLASLILVVSLLAVSSPAHADPIFPTLLSQNTTGFSDSLFIGPPNDLVEGLAFNHVTYDFGAFRVVDGVGVDINVYELDIFTAEFSWMDVLISADGATFSSIKSTETTLVRIAGDGTHSNNSNARSYDLAGSGLTAVRFVTIQGLGTNGTVGTRSGFDLDAIGAHHTAAIPEPTSLSLIVVGVLGLALRRSPLVRAPS